MQVVHVGARRQIERRAERLTQSLQLIHCIFLYLRVGGHHHAAAGATPRPPFAELDVNCVWLFSRSE
jgi:hypothetical protein